MIPIYSIVEGHGDVRAVPLLIRRICGEVFGIYDVQVFRPHRVPRGRMMAHQAGELERAVELGARKIRQTGTPGVIMVMLDADDDCPAVLGPTLLNRVSRADVETSVVVANREYEAWFLAGAQSLRGHRGITENASAPADPEAIRDAKRYLECRFFEPGSVYRPTVDQPALTAALGLEEARVAPSFDKLVRDLQRLLLAAANRQYVPG